MTIWTTIRDLVTFRSDLPAPIEERAIATTLGPWQAGTPVYPTREIATYDNQGYRTLGLIFAAVTMTSEAVASATLRVYDEAKDNETIPNHPLRQLMRRPNPEMEEARFLSMITMIASIAGFCVVEKERSAAGRVVALWPLRSDWLRPILRSQAPPDWEYSIPGRTEKIILEADDVLVFPYADTPGRSPFGIGPLEVCLREVGLLNRMTDFIKHFFDTGAVPFYGLIPDLQPGDHMSQQDVDELADQWVRRHGGLDRAVRPAVLQSIKDIKRLGLDMNELAYTELRDLSDLTIAQAFRIPASMLQIRVGLQHSDSRANAEVDEFKFYRQTITPLWRRLDGIMTLNLLPEFEPVGSSRSLEFDTSKISALQDDENARHARVRDDHNARIITLNEARVALGYSDLGEDGNVFPVLFNVTFLKPEELAGTNQQGPLFAPVARAGETQPEAEADAKAAEAQRMQDLAYRLAMNRRKELPATTPPNGSEPIRATSRQLAEIRALAANPVEYRAAGGDVSRKLIGRVADRSEPEISAFFREQGRRIIPKVTAAARVTANGATEHRDAAEMIPWDAEDEALRAILQKLHLLAGRTAFTAIADTYGIDVGIDFSLANPRVRDVVDLLGQRVTGINETTRADIQRVVTNGLQEGKSTTAIADDLTGMFEETYRNRAMTIARTESKDAYGFASQLGFQESGVVDRAQIFDNPNHVDPYGASDGMTCAERDGIVVPLDRMMFHIEADHPNGSAVGTPVLIGEAV